MREQRTSGPQGVLTIEGAGGELAEHVLSEQILIGRASDNTVVVSDPGVSRRHALVRAEPNGEVVIVDLGSSNGTYLCRRASEVRVTLPMALRSGDILRVGATRMRFFAAASADTTGTTGGSAHTVPTLSDVEQPATLGLTRIVGCSPATLEVLRMARLAADSDVPVLIRGETGTGKDLIANAIHEANPRTNGRTMIRVNCAALAESLCESELFGHRRGAFTGAVSDRAGYFEAADGGTLFLDEIGEMSPAIQAKILRALEAGEIVRVGESSPRRVTVRILAATNRDLLLETKRNTFREDLYYRLSGLTILVPPLRERREDIPLIARRLLADGAARQSKRLPELGERVLEALTRYDWPGNIRELRNEIECALAQARGARRIDVIHLSSSVARGGSHPTATGMDSASASADVDGARVRDAAVALLGEGDLRGARLAAERMHIQRVLREQGGTVAAAARILGLTRPALSRKLKRLGLR